MHDALDKPGEPAGCHEAKARKIKNAAFGQSRLSTLRDDAKDTIHLGRIELLWELNRCICSMHQL